MNFILGNKQLDDDWGQLDEHAEFGVLGTFGSDEWPVHVAVDLIVTGDTINDVPSMGSRLDIEGFTTEFDVGVRKIWQAEKMRPFLGGGLAFVRGSIDFIDSRGVSFGEDDQGIGLWADGGVFWRLGRRFNIGFEIRVSRAEVEPRPFGEAVELEAGGEHVGLLLGWGW